MPDIPTTEATLLSLPLATENSVLLGLSVAIGLGLLIGTERERHNSRDHNPMVAGVRTYTAVSLLGAISMLFPEQPILGLALILVGGLLITAYGRANNPNPGITSEIALLLTCLLGGLAMRDTTLAAGLGAGLTLLLAIRQHIHRFIRGMLTDTELHDALLFAAAIFIILPLAPDRAMGPFQALNPHAIVKLVILIMAVSALGYLALRLLGARIGLPLAGLAGGFVSSTATIYAMGQRARDQPAHMTGAVAGAVLSSIATIVQLVLILQLLQPQLLQVLLVPLLCGGSSAMLYSLFFIKKFMLANPAPEAATLNHDLGRAFDLKAALVFAALVSTVMVVSAGLRVYLGVEGTLLAAAVAGVVDAHATAISVASLLTANKMLLSQASLPILIAFSSNAGMKSLMAYKSGGLPYAMRIVPGLLLMTLATWGGVLLVMLYQA